MHAQVRLQRKPGCTAPPARRGPTARTGPHVQRKPRLGVASDPLEHEADRIADAVLAGRFAAVSRDSAGPVRRKCGAGACEAGCTGCSERAAGAVAAGGEALAPALRAYFEPRFGRDFSAVRVHTGAGAAQAAEAIGARAYTYGQGIGFAPAAYAPGTDEGRRLIAHELAHVVQQAPFVARQAAAPYSRRFRDRGGGGTTDFEETVANPPTRTGDIIEGYVDRREIAPVAPGHPAEQDVSSSEKIGRNVAPYGPAPSQTGVHVRFDASACRMTLPYTFHFIELPTAPAPFCQEPPSGTAVEPLGRDRVAEIGRHYVEMVNRGLSDRFRARMTGCAEPCTDRPIPITVDARLSSRNPDTWIGVVNRAGRGNAKTICAGNFGGNFALHEGSDNFVRHEAGHQVLRLGDEYVERDPLVLAANPQWGRPERSRSDNSIMGEDSPHPGAQFHERHFRFAQVFLEAAFPGCTVSLETVPRISLFATAGVGYARANGANYSALNFDVGLARPMFGERRLELLASLGGTLMRGGGARGQEAFIAGARLGFNVNPRRGSSLQFGAGLRVGTARFPDLSPYVEASAGFGFAGGDASYYLRAEAALGAEIRDDPSALRLFRIGFTASRRF